MTRRRRWEQELASFAPIDFAGNVGDSVFWAGREDGSIALAGVGARNRRVPERTEQSAELYRLLCAVAEGAPWVSAFSHPIADKVVYIELIRTETVPVRLVHHYRDPRDCSPRLKAGGLADDAESVLLRGGSRLLAGAVVSCPLEAAPS